MDVGRLSRRGWKRTRPISVESKEDDLPPTDISDHRTSLQAYSIQQSHLDYWENRHDARRSRFVPAITRNRPYRNKLGLLIKLEYLPIVPGMVIVKPVCELFTRAVDYRSYHLIKKWTWYNSDLVNEVNKLTKKTNVRMKDQTLNRKDPVSIIAYRQNFKATCNASSKHEGMAILLLKH